MRGKNLQAYWRTAKIFNEAGGKICRKDVRVGLCEQALASPHHHPVAKIVTGQLRKLVPVTVLFADFVLL